MDSKTESLNIELHDEKEVELILKTFPNLKYLNGHPVNPEDFIDEPSNEEIDQEGQELSKSIENIHQIKEEDDEDEPEGPIQANKTQEQDTQKINGPSSHSAPSSESQESSDMEEINLRPKDLESIALIFDKIRNLHRKNKFSNDREMASQFDSHLKS